MPAVAFSLYLGAVVVLNQYVCIHRRSSAIGSDRENLSHFGGLGKFLTGI
eukprot:m.1294472 g.1294472  ORF g.1294472 m.1294472 type:complete len:50 (+) comp24788_c0_seq3:162-311(+)